MFYNFEFRIINFIQSKIIRDVFVLLFNFKFLFYFYYIITFFSLFFFNSIIYLFH
jgi:hypothetical protein